MTHLSDVTNGASLEDCHTNFFALADLSGIKWRRLYADSALCCDPLEDPVLSSYAKCLSSGILCVWRRVISQRASFQHPNPLNDAGQLNCGKELWLFWYGEEPDLTDLVGPNLTEAEQGSWETGLSYECRTLLFKALHNLIEKCLLLKGYTRLGHFFIDPQCSFHHIASRSQIAFAFNFFVHGESTVCTSIDVRLAPSIFRLKKCHLVAAQSEHSNVKVILSPYGLQGTLTGHSYRRNDPAVSKILNEWHHFYPHPQKKSGEVNDLPAVVEVLIGGVHMKYPSSYVYVVEQDCNDCSVDNGKNVPDSSPTFSSTLNIAMKPCPSLSLLTPPTSPERNFELYEVSQKSKSNVTSKTSINARFCCTTFEEDERPSTSAVVKMSVKQESSFAYSCEGNDDSSVLWDFQKPSTIAKCACSKKSTSAIDMPTSIIETDSMFSPVPRSVKIERTQPPMQSIPFHKRNCFSQYVADGSSASDIRNFTHNDSVSSVTNSCNSSHIKGTSNVSSVSGLVAFPQLHTPLTQPSSVDSHSNVPSVETSCSQMCSSDPIMPTLSPHPPVIVKEEPLQSATQREVTFTHSPNTDIGPTINIKEKTVSDKLLPPSYASLLNFFESAKDTDDNGGPSTKSAKLNSLAPEESGDVENTNAKSHTQPLKRPVLPVDSPYDTSEPELVMRGMLYNYEDVDSLFSDFIPRKKRCVAFYNNTDSSMNSDDAYESTSDVKEHLSECNSVPNFMPKDPYEFTDFEEATPSSEGFRQPLDVRIKEEEKSSPCVSPITPEMAPSSPLSKPQSIVSLEDVSPAICDLPIPIPSPPTPRNSHQKFIRAEDLAVTVHDLDNIFDTSSSDGDDMSSDPSLTKMLAPADELSVKAKTSNLTSGFLDLSRMFPTPPSLEQNATPSPLGTALGSDNLTETENGRDINDLICGSLNLDVKDCAVYKTSEVQFFLESVKYAPLPGIPDYANQYDGLVYKPSWLLRNLNRNFVSISQMNADHTVELKQYLSQQKQYTNAEDDLYSQQYMMDRGLEQHYSTNANINSPSSTVSPFISRHLNCIEDSSMPPPKPEAHCLFVNLLLSDSMLNLFKDHNFDSCSLCVCNMNIKGADVGINLPNSLMPPGIDEPQYKCTCGFSAVVHRHRSYGSGLFHEDEIQITGFSCDENFFSRYRTGVSVMSGLKADSKKDLFHAPDQISPSLIELIKIQCKSLISSFSLFQKPDSSTRENMPLDFNPLIMHDGCEICFDALDVGKNVMDNVVNYKLDENQKSTCLHKWPYTYKPIPPSSHEVMLQLDQLKPILQEAVHKRNIQRMWEVTYVVSGPLTWREFHRLAARGNEDQCELQPIPSISVGHEKDCVSVSPFSLKFWDKLLLEPYSLPRDVAYIVVAPENDYILSNVKAFFHELSSTYELYRLGRHNPITKVLRDGIMRVGRNAALKLADEPVDEWFNQIGDSPLASKLKLYARVCQYRLAPYLSTLPLDKTLFENSLSAKSVSEKSFGTVNSPATNEAHDCGPKLSDSDNVSENVNGLSSVNGNQNGEQSDDDDQECPAIVIYIVEPFTFSSVDPDLCRLVTLGLLHCYSQVLKCLPSSIQNNVNVQLLSLDSILCLDKTEKNVKRTDELRALAFSVYNQCHRILPRQTSVKSLTGFGPAAAQDMFLSSKSSKAVSSFCAYNQPVILASLKDKQKELNEMFGDRREKSGILFCSYCLTEDRKWLLASCTNDKGELFETTVINISTPIRSRQKCIRVMRYGLRKLLDFILEVLSNSICPWRIIIGRLGRMGHGELKDWAVLLSRKSLLSYSRHLKDLCKQCSGMGVVDTPSILSACLISLSPDSALRIMPDQFTPDESSNSSWSTCDLSTPEDASCTHILVFPTSATMQSSQSSYHQENIGGGIEDDDLFDVDDLNVDDINVGQDMNDIFGWTESSAQSPGNSPHHDGVSQPGSPNAGNRHSPFHQGGPNQSLSNAFETPDDPLQLLQQPLALGYYVSTAKTGPLPKWFWSSCPHLSNSLPVFLKFALLIHMPSIQQNSDDILHTNAQQANCHPLDSTYTNDVLRYVLESYNALSWLFLDPSSRDRKSCLPVHIQILMQLYRIVENLL